MKINILLCDVFEDLMPFEDISYNSMIESLFNRVHEDIQYEYFEAFDRDLPNRIDTEAIYLIPGSRYDAYSNATWLIELRKFIHELYLEKAKMIGICFGHQIIAESLGGRVEKAIAGFGLGIRQAEIQHPLMARYLNNKQLSLLNYHQDQVVILPETAELIASSSFCPIEAYTISDHVICVQGHPEFDNHYMKYLLHHHANGLSEIIRMKAAKSLEQKSNALDMAKFMIHFIQTKNEQKDL